MLRVLLALSFLCVASAAFAASAPTPPPKLEALRKALATAVKAHDRKAIVKLSRFPIAFRGYEAPEKITEAEFLSDKETFSSLFYDGGEQIVTCLATGKLEYQKKDPDFPGSPWFIGCDGNLYYFGRAGGAWRFTSYQNDNE